MMFSRTEPVLHPLRSDVTVSSNIQSHSDLRLSFTWLIRGGGSPLTQVSLTRFSLTGSRNPSRRFCLIRLQIPQTKTLKIKEFPVSCRDSCLILDLKRFTFFWILWEKNLLKLSQIQLLKLLKSVQNVESVCVALVTKTFSTSFRNSLCCSL